MRYNYCISSLIFTLVADMECKIDLSSIYASKIESSHCSIIIEGHTSGALLGYFNLQWKNKWKTYERGWEMRHFSLKPPSFPASTSCRECVRTVFPSQFWVYLLYHFISIYVSSSLSLFAHTSFLSFAAYLSRIPSIYSSSLNVCCALLFLVIFISVARI